jgi:membrane-bound ClpP family serine protease
MTLGLAAILLVLAGVILIAGEMLLPTQGILGILGGTAVLAAVVIGFGIHPWLGVGMLAACAVAIPFVGALAMRAWPKTPMGRRMVLPAVTSNEAAETVRVGQEGVTVSELRPMGTCKFDGVVVEATSEHGIVPPGAAVRIIALVNHRPLVRVV